MESQSTWISSIINYYQIIWDVNPDLGLTLTTNLMQASFTLLLWFPGLLGWSFLWCSELNWLFVLFSLRECIYSCILKHSHFSYLGLPGGVIRKRRGLCSFPTDLKRSERHPPKQINKHTQYHQNTRISSSKLRES